MDVKLIIKELFDYSLKETSSNSTSTTNISLNSEIQDYKLSEGELPLLLKVKVSLTPKLLRLEDDTIEYDFGSIAFGNTFKGEKGDTGPLGPQGELGILGPLGIQGERGLTGATGATGAKGDKGDKGDLGEQGPQGILGIQGILGEKGATGETGPQGPEGPKGSDAEVTKENVEKVLTGNITSHTHDLYLTNISVKEIIDKDYIQSLIDDGDSVEY